MYRWAWDHLPGPVALRAAIVVLLSAAALVLLFRVVSPALQPSAPTSGDDGIRIGQDDVVEPDGVRATPRPVPTELEPTPVIPEDSSVPQQ